MKNLLKRKIKMPNEESLEDRLKGKQGSEPTQFFKQEQIDKALYEHAGSKDISIEDSHKVSMVIIEKEEGPGCNPKDYGEFIVNNGGHYLVDTKGRVLINKIREKKVVEKARQLADKLGYDGFLIDDESNKWKMVDLRQGKWSRFWATSKYEVSYIFKTIIEFYKKKEQKNAD